MLRTQCQSLLLVATMIVLSPLATFAQQPSDNQPAGQRQTAGVVASSRSGSVLIKTDDGKFLVFRVDRDTVRPQNVQVGARVNIVTRTDDTDATPLAIAIAVTQARPSGAAPADEPIPPEVRRLENRIAREVKRYRAGVEAGVALDPQLISVGAYATFGPVFNRNVSFRPTLELAAGEVTTMIALNLDVLYALPGATRQTKWAPYVGAGPNISFSHQGFSSVQDGNRFDFGEFNFDNAFNFIVGARNPAGMFVEMKATTYGASNVRFLVGYTF